MADRRGRGARPALQVVEEDWLEEAFGPDEPEHVGPKEKERLRRWQKLQDRLARAITDTRH